MTVSTLDLWRSSLEKLLHFYLSYRKKTRFFFLQLFLLFVVVNISCYWLAMLTAFPQLLSGYGFNYYFKIQFPVGVLGALFDSLSFYLTIWIIKRAIRSTTAAKYLGHLSLDFVIACCATAWVLFVFSISGWLVSLTEPESFQLAERAQLYEDMVVAAVNEPRANWQNIYFGMIMGLSAMIPTSIHIFMSLRAFVLSKLKAKS